MSGFGELGLAEPVLRALQEDGLTTPTPIQARAIPLMLAGRDVCGMAQTGTGKTAAFALPVLQRLMTTSAPPSGVAVAAIRALVLAPTRELAVQIDEVFAACGRHVPEVRHAVVFGGMKMRAQRRALGEGVEVLVATPGRLLDLIGQGVVDLGKVEILVLDEADRMLDPGFQVDVRNVVKRLPAKRQVALFSATFPQSVERLVAALTRNPARVSVAPRAAPVRGVEQFVRFVEHPEKRAALLELLADPSATRVVVFVRTRDRADRLMAMLRTERVRADAIHADRPQPDRLRALASFAAGEVRVLVATDIAARGLDIDGVTHVVNHEVPNVVETYVHRIGRTARAGAQGVAVTFCTAAERLLLQEIERVTGKALEVVA